MTVTLISETNPGPEKQGRVHKQFSIGGPSNLGTALEALDLQMAIDYAPDPYRRAGYRLEEVPDGAGKLYYNLYAYYDPVDADVVRLNPRNLNGAEQVVFGQVVDPDDATHALGRQERRF